MDTREYTDRKRTKRVTRHPAYQEMRERAVAAEKKLHEVRVEKQATDRALDKALGEIETLRALAKAGE